MIQFATTADVSTLLARVRSHAGQYSELVLCSPFIDDDVLSTLREFAQRGPDVGCGIEIITATPTFNRIIASGGMQGRRQTRIIGCPHLHAKFYLARGRKVALTEAIVTSANLTTPGLTSNIELGVRVTPTTPHGCVLFNQIDRFARRLAIHRSVQWKRQ
jgi:hypothetical protein